MARVILDGYNVLLCSGRSASEADRDDLVREAARYRGERGVEVTIVFDSRRGGTMTERTRFPGVHVRFAKGDADSAILKMVEKSSSPRDLLVVTNDRPLASAARDLGARTADVDTFRSRATQRRSTKKGPVKGERPLSKKEVEEWMEYFGKDPE